MDIKRELEVMQEVEAANKRYVEEYLAEEDGILAVFVDVYGQKIVRPIRIANDGEAFREKIGCRVLEMPFRWIGGKPFVLIADEEGTYHDDCRVSARNGDEIITVGNLLVVAFNGEDDIRGLTRGEADHVMAHVAQLIETDTFGFVDQWQVLTDVTYTGEEHD